MKLELKAGYMRRAFEAADQIAANLRECLDAYNITYDTLVGTGLSGSLVVPRVAEALGLDWMIVRKSGDGSHSNQPAEGSLGARWLFVDDCTDSGNTYKRVYRVIEELAAVRSHVTEHVGAYMYQGDYYENSTWITERLDPPKVTHTFSAEPSPYITLDRPYKFEGWDLALTNACSKMTCKVPANALDIILANK